MSLTTHKHTSTLQPTLYIGTCSWKYPSWQDLVYDAADPRPLLAQYAERYNTVEVDQWFYSLGRTEYRLPDAATVRSYDHQSPADFRFTIKGPNTLTTPFFDRAGAHPNPWFLEAEVLYRFLETLGPLLPKVGMMVLQFPYLNQHAMKNRSRFEETLSRFADALPDSVPIGVEIRNPAWLDRRWFSLLSELGLCAVLLSGYWMDPLLPVAAEAFAVGSDPLCIRLLGDDRAQIEQEVANQWDQIVSPRDEELGRLITLLAEQRRTIYLNVNNHYEGSAPRTIERIYTLLEGV
jgi:uncharacterized protein YecE (DUF72 family)